MEYWQGYMNWEKSPDWKCEICGQNQGLTWGFVHAQCRCNVCHTQYRMRNKDGDIVTIPICQLKPEYYEAFKILWEKYKRPIEKTTDVEWDEVLVRVSNEN